GAVHRPPHPACSGIGPAQVGRDLVSWPPGCVHDRQHGDAPGGGRRSLDAIARAPAEAPQAAGVTRRAAVLAPGYGGTAEQPILKKLAAALASFAIESRAVTFRTRGSRPSKDYTLELDDLRQARDALQDAQRIALVGRSFGGRMCAFLAEREPPDALVIM